MPPALFSTGVRAPQQTRRTGPGPAFGGVSGGVPGAQFGSGSGSSGLAFGVTPGPALLRMGAVTKIHPSGETSRPAGGIGCDSRRHRQVSSRRQGLDVRAQTWSAKAMMTGENFGSLPFHFLVMPVLCGYVNMPYTYG